MSTPIPDSQPTDSDFVTIATEVNEAPADDVIGRLGIEPMLFLGQLVNFLIVLVVLWLFAYKPLLRLMKQRTARIEEGLLNARQVEERLAALERDREGVLADARTEARAFVSAAMSDAEEKKAAVIASAKDEVGRVVEVGRAQLASDRQRMMQEVKADVVALVVEALRAVAPSVAKDASAQKRVQDALERAAKDL